MARFAAAFAAALIHSAAANANFALPLNPTSVLVVRVNSSSTTAWIDELSIAGQLPPLQSVAVAGCTLATGADQAYGSNSPDGQVCGQPGARQHCDARQCRGPASVSVARRARTCPRHPCAPVRLACHWQFAVFSCGLTGSKARTVARIAASSTLINTGFSYTTSATTYLPRGATTLDGTGLYAADAHAVRA